MKKIKGLDLSEKFYREVVSSQLHSQWPRLQYAAALIGDGSEILGFDTERSKDHDFGARLFIFLSESDFGNHALEISTFFEKNLPQNFAGHLINFDDRDRATYDKELMVCGSPKHAIEIFTIRSFFKRYLDWDIEFPISTVQWLSFSEQLLLGATSGRIFHDAVGLEKIRKKLQFYPHDTWLYILAAQWIRISQEEAFLGRCGELKDTLGASMIAARLVRELIHLCFLMEKKYMPYSKWLGTGFCKLKCAPILLPIFEKALTSSTSSTQEKYLCEAYEIIASMHNELGITDPLGTAVSNYHDRPYKVISAGRFANAIYAKIQDPEVKTLRKNIGSVNQFIDSTDVLCAPVFCKDLVSHLKTGE